MGRRIITNGIDKWELFSSITDSVLADFNTEADLKRFLALDSIYDAKLKAIEGLLCYPRNWTVNDVPHYNANAEQFAVYLDWSRAVSKASTTYEDYYKAIDAKLDELMALNPEE